MEIQLTRTLMREVTDFLVPYFAQEAQRLAILNRVFTTEPSLVASISVAGAAQVFVVNMITRLQHYGTIDGVHCLVILLEELVHDEGESAKRKAVELIARMTQGNYRSNIALPSPTSGSTGGVNIHIGGNVSGGNVNIGGNQTIGGGGDTPPPATPPAEGGNAPQAPYVRNQVFISYSHRDNRWLEELLMTLKPMIRGGLKLWSDEQIQTGQRWRDEINTALAQTKVAVLLVSRPFMASDFIANHELPPLLKAAETDGVKIVWIPVSAAYIDDSEIREYQAAWSPSKPLDTLSEGELSRALVEISREIKRAYES